MGKGTNRAFQGFICSVLILGAVFFLQKFFSNPLNAEANSPFGSALESGNLSCKQIERIVQWSKVRYGGTFHFDPKANGAAAKVALSFIEKVDPFRVLYLKAEIESLQNAVGEKWGDCLVFERYLNQSYPQVQKRTERLLHKLDLKLVFKNLGSKTADIDGEFRTKYATAAVNEAELERRLGQLITELGETLSAKLLTAYAGNYFQLAFDLVEEHFFSRKIDARALLAKAILSNMDPYSTYFSPDEFQDFYDELTGSTAGIGVKVQKSPKGFLVARVLEGSAAEASRKIHEGDLIEAINGVSLQNLSMEQAKPLFKGPENSRVDLSLRCKVLGANGHESASEKELSVALYRKKFIFEESKITHRFVVSKNSDSKVGVITIPSFYGKGGMGQFSDERSSSEDLKQIVEEMTLKSTKATSIVLDLRGNPGGYLEEAVSMGGIFLGSKPVVGVVEQGRTRVLSDEEHFEPVYDKALVVLVDESSASASEVLSGALKDYHRAIIVGAKTTYGKGSVQKLFHLDDPMLALADDNKSGNGGSKGVLKLTTSVFYSPLGHTPANGGVKTDIQLSLDQNSKKAHSTGSFVNDISPILEAELREELEAKSNDHSKLIEKLQAQSLNRRQFAELTDEDSILAEAVQIAADLSGL